MAKWKNPESGKTGEAGPNGRTDEWYERHGWKKVSGLVAPHSPVPAGQTKSTVEEKK